MEKNSFLTFTQSIFSEPKMPANIKFEILFDNQYTLTLMCCLFMLLEIALICRLVAAFITWIIIPFCIKFLCVLRLAWWVDLKSHSLSRYSKPARINFIMAKNTFSIRRNYQSKLIDLQFQRVRNWPRTEHRSSAG